MSRAVSKKTPTIDIAEFFGETPRYCIAALQAAFDKISDGRNGKLPVYKSLSRDFEALGEPKPDEKAFDRFFEATICGEVIRPTARPTMPPIVEDNEEDALDPVASAIKETLRGAVTKAGPEVAEANAVDVSTPHTRAADPDGPTDIASPYQPQTKGADERLGAGYHNTPHAVFKWPAGMYVSEQEQGAFAALRAATDRLVSEIIQDLSANIEQSARESAARIMRELADELDRH